MKVLVTGGAGFIGAALVKTLIEADDIEVINVDVLTYAGNLESLRTLESSAKYAFEKVDITDSSMLGKVFSDRRPDAVIHLAAESHVDRSIDDPGIFIRTNIVGTFTLLECVREYLATLTPLQRDQFRFHHVSTDEVFGDIADVESFFTESSPYSPSSPYSASKSASDHLVRAWGRTYDIPVLISNCSNNYGPFQYPEKLIPLMILNALAGKPMPVYGNGEQVRDWLFVDDHAKALIAVLTRGVVGETYLIGGHNEKTNIEVVRSIASLLDELVPERPGGIASYLELISFVDDRPGHDIRYAIDASKIGRELGWFPDETFESGLRRTVEWYLANRDWCARVQSDVTRSGD